MEISCHLEKDIGNVVIFIIIIFNYTMYLNLINTLIQKSDHGAACYLIDLQKAIDLTSFILLFLHLLAEALSLTLLNGVRGLKRPATPPIRLPHIITGIATPAEQPVSVLNHVLNWPYIHLLLTSGTDQKQCGYCNLNLLKIIFVTSHKAEII